MKRAFVAPTLSTVASLAGLTQTGIPVSGGGDPGAGLSSLSSDD